MAAGLDPGLAQTEIFRQTNADDLSAEAGVMVTELFANDGTVQDILTDRPQIGSGARFGRAVLDRLTTPAVIVGTALSALGALVPAAAAEAKGGKIVVGQSIDGIDIGETQSQLVQKLGSPASGGTGQSVWRYGSPEQTVVSFNNGGKVIGMWTPNKQLRTNKGVGVGSSPQQIKKAYPGIKCTPGAGPGGPKSLACVIMTKHDGQKVETAFEFRSKPAGVSEVDIDVVA